MFVITNHDKTKFVGLDSASGGYPYVTDHQASAYMFRTQESAEKERDTSYPDMEVARVLLKII